MKFYCAHCGYQVEAEKTQTPQSITYSCPHCMRLIAEQLLMKELYHGQGNSNAPSRSEDVDDASE